ncbi:MAG: EVE domain-containing protein [Candidatus Wallbacteria bacterium]|nr:EVE domain-containing protein [Candidatus Wallbacteria bacterium]
MAYWLLKTEPEVYSWDDLVRDKRTVWDGVANNLALIHIRKARKGDRALVYHTGGVRAAVGTARLASDPYPDPKLGDPKLAVFDVEPEKALSRPVTLEAIKAEPELAGWDLIRLGRLSVVPVSAQQWKLVLKLGGAR